MNRRQFSAIGFCVGFALGAIAIKQAWGPHYSWGQIAGIVLVVGVIVGGVGAGLVFMLTGKD